MVRTRSGAELEDTSDVNNESEVTSVMMYKRSRKHERKRNKGEVVQGEVDLEPIVEVSRDDNPNIGQGEVDAPNADVVETSATVEANEEVIEVVEPSEGVNAEVVEPPASVEANAGVLDPSESVGVGATDGTFDGLEAIVQLTVESVEPPRDSSNPYIDGMVQASQASVQTSVQANNPTDGATREPGSSRPQVEPCASVGANVEASEDLEGQYDSEMDVDTTELLRDWEKHTAYGLWKKTKDRGLIMCKQYTTSLHKWELKDESDQFLTRLKEIPFYNMLNEPYSQANKVIVCGFIERWHPETNTFHLPFGEMTITLDDVRCITGLPVSGNPVSHTFPKEFNYAQFVTDCLGIEASVVSLEIEHCQGHRLSKSWLKSKLSGKCGQDGITVDQAVRGYLLYFLGCTLFQDRSGDKIPIAYLYFLLYLDKVNEWAWGAATLANLYRQLSKATGNSTVGVSGYLTLLEVWVYEHFPTLRPAVNNNFVEGKMPMSNKWKTSTGLSEAHSLTALRHLREDLNLMNARDVVWDAYKSKRTLSDNDISWFYGCIRTLDIVEPYHPNRVVRQFGHIQSIPQPPIPPKKARRSGTSKGYNVAHEVRDDDFKFYRNHLVNKEAWLGKARFEWETTSDYMPWWCKVAVRRLTSVTRRKRRDPIQDDEGKNKMIAVLEDVRQNRSKISKKDLLNVIDMAYEFLVSGSVSVDAPGPSRVDAPGSSRVDALRSSRVEIEDADAERRSKRPRTSFKRPSASKTSKTSKTSKKKKK